MFKKLNFNKFTDGRGDLVPLEFGDNYDVPFDVKRAYFITPTSDEVRGNHAHRWVEQVAICVKGSFNLCLDDGSKKETFLLNNHSEGVYMDKHVWNTLKDFSDDCVILVLASDHYDAKEYINDYQEFLSIVDNRKLELIA